MGLTYTPIDSRTHDCIYDCVRACTSACLCIYICVCMRVVRCLAACMPIFFLQKDLMLLPACGGGVCYILCGVMYACVLYTRIIGSGTYFSDSYWKTTIELGLVYIYVDKTLVVGQPNRFKTCFFFFNTYYVCVVPMYKINKISYNF